MHRKRDAQPIYPLDAAAIVALADVHVDEREVDVQQFLEAGTGHGSLTLAICKAIHGANGPARAATAAATAVDPVDSVAADGRTEPTAAPSTNSAAEKRPDLRKAILHSIDRNATHSRTGRHNVRDFRRGMYREDVEFHVCDSPEEWLRERSGPWRDLNNYSSSSSSSSGSSDSSSSSTSLPTTGVDKKEFLHGAFLDLPSPFLSISAISSHLVVDAPLVVFCPSVTQIQDMVEYVRVTLDVDLTLVNTVELMPGSGGGSMREWDVRSTVVRQTGELVRVCRPRVGSLVVGGGFVAVFRRLPGGSRKQVAEAKAEAKAEAEVKAKAKAEADAKGEAMVKSEDATADSTVDSTASPVVNIKQ